jgi:hypothetical protein
MNQESKKRLLWIKLFEEIQNAGMVCRRCGISRPTLRKRLRRYQNSGLEGLISENRRPIHSPAKKIFSEQEEWILDLRKNRNSGARCIQNELRRIHGFNLSLATIHKVLTKHRVKPLVRLRRGLHQKRYSRPIPRDRVQMDTCKIAPGLYQYTAIDDCTRYQVLALFPRRNAESTLEFFEKAIEEMPFPVQRIQTHRGGEFFALPIPSCCPRTPDRTLDPSHTQPLAIPSTSVESKPPCEHDPCLASLLPLHSLSAMPTFVRWLQGMA